METTMAISKSTLQLLKRVKHEFGSKTYDEVIRTLVERRKKIPESMFATLPKLKPLSIEEEEERWGPEEHSEQ